MKAVKSTTPTKTQKTVKTSRACRCPFCDEEIKALNLPTCSSCGVAIVRCEVCHIPLPKEAKTCPQCGKKLVK